MEHSYLIRSEQIGLEYTAELYIVLCPDEDWRICYRVRSFRYGHERPAVEREFATREEAEAVYKIVREQGWAVLEEGLPARKKKKKLALLP